MFFYKITVRTKHGKEARTSRNLYREALDPTHVGEQVGGQLGRPSVTSVSVTKISQAAYLRAVHKADV